MLCKCDAKTGAMKTCRVWWTKCKRVRSTTGFRSNHVGRLKICSVSPMKLFWLNSVFVNKLKEQKSAVTGNRSCQQSLINDTQGWSQNVKTWALYFRHSNLCLMNNGISLHECWRHTTGMLGMAPRHKRSASFCILSKEFDILGEEKNMLPCRILSQI